MRAQYQTKQRNELKTFLAEHAGRHLTVVQIQEGLEKIGISIGTATIYRYLKTLVEEGCVVKYITGPGTSACFEYLTAGELPDASDEFHCKCLACGRLIHIECAELAGVGRHLSQQHHFRIDSRRTVFYGLCENCWKAQQQ